MLHHLISVAQRLTKASNACAHLAKRHPIPIMSAIYLILGAVALQKASMWSSNRQVDSIMHAGDKLLVARGGRGGQGVVTPTGQLQSPKPPRRKASV